MKLLNILYKNFKILLRSKSSAFIVVMVPMLIIALILLTFSTTQDYTINLGVITADSNELVDEFIVNLKDDSYNVVTYFSLEQCINDVKLGSIHLCLEFPQDFDLGSGKANNFVEFHVDPSRINLVNSIVSSISDNLGSVSEEITTGQTQDLLAAINSSASTINTDLVDIEVGLASVDDELFSVKSSAGDIGDAASDLAELDAQDHLDDLDTRIEEVSTSQTEIYDKASALVDELNGASYSGSGLDDLEGILDDENTDITDSVTDIQGILENLRDEVEDTNSQISGGSDIMQGSSSDIEDNVDEIISLIDEIEVSLTSIEDQKDLIQAYSTQSVENPFDIHINKILSASNQSIFMFPYYVMLLVLFVAMMLSASLVVMETESLAFFRTFTTPTDDLSHIFARFLTVFIILAVQLGIVFGAASYFLEISVLGNYSVTLTILFLSVSLFIFIGASIGYLFKTQEAVTIAFISVAGLFSFLSNLILPVESFSQSIRKVLLFNPYMLSSELLKKSILFRTGFVQQSGDFWLLVAYAIAAFFLVIFFQKLSFDHFLNFFAKRGILKRPHITEEDTFRLEDGTDLEDLDDLEKALEKMDNKEYNEYVVGKNNEFALWIRTVLKDKKLACKVRKTKTRKEMIHILIDKRTNVKKRGWLGRFIFKD